MPPPQTEHVANPVNWYFDSTRALGLPWSCPFVERR